MHNWGDGQASQANLTWVSGESRHYAVEAVDQTQVRVASQISDSVPVPSEVLSDSLIVDGLEAGVGATMEVQLFDLTVDPLGWGAPLGGDDVGGERQRGLPRSRTVTITAGVMGHRLGYRHRVPS